MARFGREQQIGPDAAPDPRDPAEQPDSPRTVVSRSAGGTYPDPPGSGGEVAVPEQQAVAAISAVVAERVREAVKGIPGDDGTGAESIVLQLLNAQTVDDLNAPWEATNGRALNGKRLKINGVTQRPSSYEDGAGIFLVADAWDAKTGEQATFTTSALSVVIQLARAHQLGLFPVIADVVVAERPTARGFYPYHLRIVAAGSQQAG